jgi:hypothetical protein
MQMLDLLLNSSLFAAVVGGVITGVFSVTATQLTLSATFKRQAETLEKEQRRKERGAGWALISEMSENLARCRAVENLANSGAPVANVRDNLTINRNVFETQLPLISLPLGPENLRTVASANAMMANLFGILEGKWGSLFPVSTSWTVLSN